MRNSGLVLLLFFFGCTHQRPATQDTPEEKLLSVTEVNPDKNTALTKQNLYQIIQIYDLYPLMFTTRVEIISGVLSRSHPVLTLNTTYAQDPHKLLAQWLHQQFHWWMLIRRDRLRKAILELEKLYPDIPDQVQERRKFWHLHFIINYLEYRALGKFIGYKQAFEVIREMTPVDKHYEWVYTQIFKDPARIRKIVEKHGLMPPALR